MKAGDIDYDFLEPDIYLRILKEAPSVQDLTAMRAQGTQMLTFKGPATDKNGNLGLTLSRLFNL